MVKQTYKYFTREAWNRSKGKRVKVRLRDNVYLELQDKGMKIDRRDEETMNGDPRYIELLMRVQDKRAKLLGYDKPDQIVLINKTEDKRDALLSQLPQDALQALTDSLIGIEKRTN